MSIESAPDSRPSPRADLWSAVFWIAFGGAIVVGSWRMDRLERMGATLYTTPGLVPGLLGAVILFFGVLLALRSLRAARNGSTEAVAPLNEHFSARVWLVLGLCLVYAVVLVGHGMPFWFATFLFVAAFVFIFEYPKRREQAQVPRGALMAFIYGAATSAIVSTVFEQIFLVRLP